MKGKTKADLADAARMKRGADEQALRCGTGTSSSLSPMQLLFRILVIIQRDV